MPGTVHIVVFSNFEGFARQPAPILRWFEACAKAHPAVRWTHLYNPLYLLVQQPAIITAEAAFSPFLLDAEKRGAAEVGIHLHLFYALMRAMEIEPRAYPFAGDTAPHCDTRRTVAEDPRGEHGGYDVLLTGYPAAEQARMLDASVAAFMRRGFRRPTAFCAGYSAATPAIQALLADKGFTVSIAAQAISPSQYGTAWCRLLDWHGHITPLTIPYRVARNSILPPPHAGRDFLDLVEVPLNMGVDKNDLPLGDAVVSREAMFDRHCDWTRQSGSDTTVTIGVHADVIGSETWEDGPVAAVLHRFLAHAAARAQAGAIAIRYATASDVGTRFWNNTTVGSVAHSRS